MKNYAVCNFFSEISTERLRPAEYYAGAAISLLKSHNSIVLPKMKDYADFEEKLHSDLL